MKHQTKENTMNTRQYPNRKQAKRISRSPVYQDLVKRTRATEADLVTARQAIKALTKENKDYRLECDDLRRQLKELNS